MITILNPTLTATIGGPNVTLTISYSVRFNQIDRHFAANGVTYREVISVMGRDIPPDADDFLQAQAFASGGWTAGAGSQTQARVRTLTIPRANLQEDPGPDDDEIYCIIRVVSSNFPTVSNATTVSPVSRNTNVIVLA